jgi:hypothetical protein
MLRRLLSLLLLLTLANAARSQPDADYVSPYRVEFSFPEEDLIGDLLRGPRSDWRTYSEAPFRDWYDRANHRRWGYWGPRMRHLPPPNSASTRPAQWARERVIATGLRYVGFGYQHRHLPDWDPPADWPRAPNQTNNAKGVDCSNFTGFVYNLALGLLPDTSIRGQAEMTSVRGPGPGRSTRVQRIELPRDHEDFPRVLRSADLLFIKNRQGNISHVVLWVGDIGRSPDDRPLILDSTGPTHRDADGARIPDGVQLRPFGPRSWYFANASHALRLIPD